MEQKVNLISIMQSLEKMSLQKKYNVKVIDVKYLGESKFPDKTRNIFLVLEEQELTDGKKVTIEKYFDENENLIAANVLNDRLGLALNPQFVKEENLDGDEKTLIKELSELNIKGKAGLRDVRKIAEKLNVKDEYVLEKCKINKNQNIPITKKDVNIKQEVKTNTKVTDEYTMEQVLNVQDKDYAEIMVVYTDDLENPGNNTKFTLMGETRSGELEVIDTVEQRYGRNPDKDIQEVNRDGTDIKTQDARSIFHIKGKEEEQIAINYGELGNIELSYVRTPRTENREGLSVPIETHNTRYTTYDVRELGNRAKNNRVNDDISRAKVQDKYMDDEMTDEQRKEIITNIKNDDIMYDEKFIQVTVDNMLKENYKIYETCNRKALEKELLERLTKYPNTDAEEVIKDMTEEKNKEADEQEKTKWNS